MEKTAFVSLDLVTVMKDTEAPVSDAKVPHVDAEVVSRQVGLPIAIDWDGIDMIGMSIGEHPSWTNLYHQVRRFEHRNLRCRKKKETNLKRSQTEVKNNREWRQWLNEGQTRVTEGRIRLWPQHIELYRGARGGFYLQGGDGRDVLEASLLIFQVVSLWSLVPLAHLPQFDGLICQERAQEADPTDRKLTITEPLTTSAFLG